MNKNFLAVALLLSMASPGMAQKKKAAINDSNTPLHLLQPDYETPYGALSIDEIKKDIDRVLRYLESCTPTRVVDKKTGKVITDYENMDQNAQLERGTFRIGSYEWGVTYNAMLIAAEATGDTLYTKYAMDRFNFLTEIFPHFQRVYTQYGEVDPLMKQMLTPHALDDAGAMCSAMMKIHMNNKSLPYQQMIDNYFNFIMYKEHRLFDGTFARFRPHNNTMWLDDMYMAIPSIAVMGSYARDHNAKFQTEAAKQVLQFSERMFLPEKGIYRHGWVEGLTEQPNYHWARANGWAMLAMCEVLDFLPNNHPQREAVLKQLRAHIKGVASYQSGSGFWHQLLDKQDSYLETSATAIFTYCIAHAVNKGWIDAISYAPVAQLGWQAVKTKINKEGQVEGTCVGTGMAFDPAFYYHRPVSEYAAHGYGPVIMAGAEMIKLTKSKHPQMNDSGLHFYNSPTGQTEPIFYLSNRPVSGASRKGSNPVAFLIGDSTVKCVGGKGEGGMWGWGSFFQEFFDDNKITVENHALGGRSSRTYFTEGLWEKVLPGIKEGDYLIVDFGHNDGGPLNTGRARASLRGTGDEKQNVVMERNAGTETVYTFGHYLRIFIRQAKAKGAHVIVTSHTPTNRWTENRVNRCENTYGKWSKEVAEQEGVFYIDLNERSAVKFEAMGGKEQAAPYYVDGVHNTQDGAKINASSIIEGLKELPSCKLNDYLK